MESVLAASRRVDWRFLLTPEFGAVAVPGGADPVLVGALRAFSSSVAVISDLRADPESHAGRYDLVLLLDPSRDEIAPATQALGRGGWLYVQVSVLRARPVRRPRVIPAYVRALRRAGLDDVTGYWYFPDVAACEEIVPIGSIAAQTFSVGRRRTARLVRAKTALAVALARAGLLGYIAPHGSVVGRRGHPE
jgi:hypothetical protein